MGMIFHPDLLPKSADPEGSERFENVTIYHEQIECHHTETIFYDDIEKNNRFIIEDLSPDYKGYEVHIFKGTVLKGTVLKEHNEYSWWHNIHI